MDSIQSALDPFALNGGNHRPLGVGPHLSARVAQPLKEPAIADKQHTDAVIRKVRIGGELLDDGKNLCLHDGKNTRNCVQVNTRNCLSARICVRRYKGPMQNGWSERLWIAVKEDGRSERAICLAANLGPNYLGQTRKRGTSPVSENLAALLDVLGQEAALYIMTGVRVNGDGVKALNALSSVPEHLREQAMGLLLALSSGQDQPFHPADGSPQTVDVAEDQPKP